MKIIAVNKYTGKEKILVKKVSGLNRAYNELRKVYVDSDWDVYVIDKSKTYLYDESEHELLFCKDGIDYTYVEDNVDPDYEEDDSKLEGLYPWDDGYEVEYIKKFGETISGIPVN